MEEKTVIKFIMENFNSIFPAIIGVFGTLFGILIPTYLNYFQNKAQRKSEEKRHLQALLLNAAMDHYKQTCILAQGEAERGIEKSIPPLDGFIINMLCIMDIGRLLDLCVIRIATIAENRDSGYHPLSTVWNVL